MDGGDRYEATVEALVWLVAVNGFGPAMRLMARIVGRMIAQVAGEQILMTAGADDHESRALAGRVLSIEDPDRDAHSPSEFLRLCRQGGRPTTQANQGKD